MSPYYGKMTRAEKIGHALGCTMRREGDKLIGKTRCLRFRTMGRIMDLPWVSDVEVELVADVDESWDGEPYDTQLEVRVIMLEEIEP